MRLNTLFKHWTYSVIAPGLLLREKYEAFKDLLEKDQQAHELMAELEEIYYGRKACGFSRVQGLVAQLCIAVGDMVHDLTVMSPSEYVALKDYFKKIEFYVRFFASDPEYDFAPPFTLLPNEFNEIDVDRVRAIGGKAEGLYVISNRLALPCPPFFCVTTNAFFYFLEYNGLRQKIGQYLAQVDLDQPQTLEDSSKAIVALLREAEIPPDIQQSISDAASEVSQGTIYKWSVRSSAVGEDTETSFAGQYETRLNVSTDELPLAYREVISSKYSPAAISYRITHGLLDLETPMAVVMQSMVEPESAGIVYSAVQGNLDRLEVHSVWGLGESAVNGSVTPDRFIISREEPDKILETVPGNKPVKLVCSAEGLKELQLPQELWKAISLSSDDAKTLAKWSLKAERLLGNYQDMEWCLAESAQGIERLMCLQTRPLMIDDVPHTAVSLTDTDSQPILTGTLTASPGAASGRVFIAKGSDSLSELPKGAILVARSIPPSFAASFSRVSAIVSEEAVSASHAATVAREAGIPFLSGVADACTVLGQDALVTVDATGKRIFAGVEKGIIRANRAETPTAPSSDTPFMSRMKSLMEFILPLNLINHESKEFRPEGCRTLHDIIRFSHEKAMQNMFSLGNRKRGSARGAKRLTGDLPLSMYVLDVGGGIHQSASSSQAITIDSITSSPMRKTWAGLSDPGIKWDQGEHFDWGEYDSVVLAGGIINKDSPSLASYAIISEDYMNLSIRFGYHFVVIDTLSSDQSANNYITFRFSGGGGDDTGRFLRAEFLKKVLERLGFDVSLKGELVDAVFRHGTREAILDRLPAIGRLLGATRLMDMRLDQESDLDLMADDFMKGRCDFVTAG